MSGGETDLAWARRHEESAAVGQLVDRFGERVYRLALRITGSEEDAEEAAQHALWTAARTIGAFEGEPALGRWLDRTAATAAYQKLRSRRGTSRGIALDDVLPPLDGAGQHFAPIDDWSPQVDDDRLNGELRAVLEQAIAALPDEYRTALVMHDVEGMSNPDIAATLAINLTAVKSRVHRSRLFVRQRLASYLAGHG